MDYIEREAVLEKIESGAMWVRSFGELYEAVQDMPSADVAPVRHGRWMDVPYSYFGTKRYECSECYGDTFWNRIYITTKYNYCPNCGCKMLEDSDGKK